MIFERIRAVWLVLLFLALAIIGGQNLQLVRFHLFLGVLVGLVAATLVVFAVTSRRGAHHQ